MARVRCLGSVEVTDGSGSLCSIDSALRRPLLSVLAIHAGQVMTADWLLEHAWDGVPLESGLRALRFHVSRLRNELRDGDLIETRPGGYRLALVPDHVDALAVEQLTHNARLQPSPRVAARMYEEALALWCGAPFADAAPRAHLDDEAARLGGDDVDGARDRRPRADRTDKPNQHIGDASSSTCGLTAPANDPRLYANGVFRSREGRGE
jgi:hypothetical protein